MGARIATVEPYPLGLALIVLAEIWLLNPIKYYKSAIRGH